ncbi:hypothetical protein [Frankia sp. R82]|uniref:hypothetical protein n=1 Tax=Frankia sp. R82 TaxID=2950553 RepID=UPI00204341A1|nr:hypothetical protein [Frankia sp. R82]MCM3886825.1 hypothetical protein [Frankia sp. R82]
MAVPVADGRLAALIGFARAGDRAAARVVLERVMPALTVQAAARSRRARGTTAVSASMPASVAGLGFGEVLAELVAAAWLVICVFPLERRPRKIAVNVVLDAVSRVFGYRSKTERSTVYLDPLPDIPVGLNGRPAIGWARQGSSAELLEVLADGLDGGAEPAQVRLLAELAVVGHSQAEVAVRAGISDRGVRLRRDAAVRALQAVVLSPSNLPASDRPPADRPPSSRPPSDRPVTRSSVGRGRLAAVPGGGVA